MRVPLLSVSLLTAGLALALVGVSDGQSPPAANSEASRIARGYQISPVRLSLRVRNRDLVGLGSYIVNAQAGCNDCHTEPPFAAGGDPYEGQPIRINTARYLAGGRQFGPGVVSANITPDETGLPAGLTFAEFKQLIRTGHDPDAPDHILQVMPWPIFRNMSDRDLLAVYEFLSAIPHVDS